MDGERTDRIRLSFVGVLLREEMEEVIWADVPPVEEIEIERMLSNAEKKGEWNGRMSSDVEINIESHCGRTPFDAEARDGGPIG